MGLVDNDLVELDSGVHPPDVGVVPEGKQAHIKKQINHTQRGPALPHMSVLFLLTA